MIYQNFDLEIIASRGDPRLHARVLQSPQGDSPFINVTWPFETEEENAFLAEIYGGLRQRRVREKKTAAIEEFGGRLFDAMFTGDIEHLFRSSLDAAYRNGEGLRIRLRLPDDSALNSRPWEFLFDTESREFLAVKEHTPLVRYLPVAQPIQPIAVEGPVRILVALAAPTDHPRLDVAREWEILSNALETPVAAGKVKLDRVPGRCTFDNLRDALRQFGAHIFHFVGHGIPGALMLEQEMGKGLEMEATQLRAAFPRGTLPRLIVLNFCSGAIGEDVPFSGLAQGFLRQGVPAVVAMQASITDDAALIFTRYFYRDLIKTGIVDASLTEARLRMQGNGHLIEWGTPVLYMRALNGQLFQPGAFLREPKRHQPRDPDPVATIEPVRDKPPPEAPKTKSPPPHPVSGQGERVKPLTTGTAPPIGTESERGQKGGQKEKQKEEPTLEPMSGLAVPGTGGHVGAVDAPPKPPPAMPPKPVKTERIPSPPDRPPDGDEPAEKKRLSSLSPYVPVAGALLLLVFAAGVYLAFRDDSAPQSAKVLAEVPRAAPAPSATPQPTVPVLPRGNNSGGGNAGVVPIKPSGTTPRKPPARPTADGCNNPDIGERPFDCLLKK